MNLLMNLESNNPFGIRLKLARKMAGMSLQELADALENKITKQSLSKYEMGLMNPTSEVLMAIAKTLKTSPDYFIKQGQIELGQIQFRKKTALLKKHEESIIEKARDYFERYVEIENLLSIKNTFENPLENFKITNREEVEEAAHKLRQYWELGNNPISNIVNMLELKGIKIFLIDDVEEIDGFAAFSSTGIPIVVINIRDKSLERIRFTIIHELAHLLLKFSEAINSISKEVEKLCHYFSSCFLLPSKKLIEMIGGNNRDYISIKELIAVKEYYGISIRAIVHRLKELTVITPSYYQRWVIWLSKKYGQKDEPGNYKGEEKSSVLEQLINRALSEDLISLSKAASLLNININQLRKDL